MPSDEDMAALQFRVNQAREQPSLPLIVVDAMLPGQRLRFASENVNLARVAEQEGSAGEVVVVGAFKGSPLRHGVVALLHPRGSGINGPEWELEAQRHVKVLDSAEPTTAGGLPRARVEAVQDDVAEVDVEVARTLLPLVMRWQSLVEGTRFERFEGQVQGVLDDLGPMPPPEKAGELALWVAALVNPLPGLGVAYEIRPAALSARTVSERLQVVLEGIRGSIGHVSGESPLF